MTNHFKMRLEDHADYLFSYAMLKLRDVSLAEDMVQDTLLSAVISMDGFKPVASVRTWLTTILRHKIIDYWRRQGHEILASEFVTTNEDGEDSIEDFFDRNGRWVDMPRAFPDPDVAMESKQFWQVFEECLSRLKPQQAEVFLDREVYGMSNEELCKNHNVSISNAWVLLHRARVSLGKCLELKWINQA
jgi:RNA polymerase sigma-70 factor (ECF subfamily)